MRHSTSPADFSNVRVMRTLLAKDWRLFRLPVIGLIVAGAGIFLFFACQDAISNSNLPQSSQSTFRLTVEAASLFAVFLMGLFSVAGIVRALLLGEGRFLPLPITGLIAAFVGAHLLVGRDAWSYAHEIGHVWTPLLITLDDASDFAILLTILLASAFGAISIAGERKERTADFLALLPVTRKQIVTSKFIVTAVVMVGFLAFYGSILLLLWGVRLDEMSQIPASAALVAALATSFFGVAWLLSTFTTSPAISAWVSIAVTLFVYVYMGAEWRWTDRAALSEFNHVVTATLLAIGLSSVIGGTIYYLRRIAP
jgi:hypothetical protein